MSVGDPVFNLVVKALVLGVVEGLTEFVPVSSTGHLILAGRALDFEGPLAVTFEVAIQLGAVLAVVWAFRADLAGRLRRLPRSADERRLAGALLVAFLPAAAVGFLAADWIQSHLFSPLPVAAAQIAGALLILWAEARQKVADTTELDGVRLDQALVTGLLQVLSLWPGLSRAGASIVGGMLAGLDRPTATRFSFYLAIPTVGAASVYALVKDARLLGPDALGLLGLGFVVSFLVALLAIRLLLRYVAHHTLAVFAWYRLGLGLLVLSLIAAGVLAP
jgi:undecaprenyl-diphosphatase